MSTDTLQFSLRRVYGAVSTKGVTSLGRNVFANRFLTDDVAFKFFLATDPRQAMNFLTNLTKTRVGTDVLGSIFSLHHDTAATLGDRGMAPDFLALIESRDKDMQGAALSGDRAVSALTQACGGQYTPAERASFAGRIMNIIETLGQPAQMAIFSAEGTLCALSQNGLAGRVMAVIETFDKDYRDEIVLKHAEDITAGGDEIVDAKVLGMLRKIRAAAPEAPPGARADARKL